MIGCIQEWIAKGRIVDLSYLGAKKLETLLAKGGTKVKVEVL